MRCASVPKDNPTDLVQDPKVARAITSMRAFAVSVVALLAVDAAHADTRRVQAGCPARVTAGASRDALCPAVEMKVSGGLRLLPRGGAVGSLIGFDPTTKVAKVRITCGWDSGRHAKLLPGIYRMSLKRATLELSSDPSNPVAAHVITVSFVRWKSFVVRFGWEGIIESVSRPFLTNGPGTDVCNGQIG